MHVKYLLVSKKLITADVLTAVLSDILTVTNVERILTGGIWLYDYLFMNLGRSDTLDLIVVISNKGFGSNKADLEFCKFCLELLANVRVA